MSNPSSPRILIVEDNLIIAAHLASELQKLGYIVLGPLMTGEEAVAAVTQEQPALVLMDIGLEGAMDGIAAAAAIRQLSNVPVIFLTGNSDQATIQRTRQAGASGVLLKPFNERTIGRQIELVLNAAGSAPRCAPAPVEELFPGRE